MKWRFTIIDRNGTNWPVEEPNGWDSTQEKIKRDKNTHGLFFEFQVGNYEFFGEGARLIRQEYETYGLQAKMDLLIEINDRGHWVEDGRCRMVFTGYSSEASNDGSVKIKLENIGEVVEFTNRWEQKVDLSATKAYDQLTDLVPYNFLNREITLPSKAIKLRTAGNNSEAFKSPNFKDDPSWDTYSVILPGFSSIQSSDIPDSQLYDSYGLIKLGAAEARLDPDQTPTLEVKALSSIGCIGANFSFRCRYKGKIEWTRSSAGSMNQGGWLYLIKSPAANPTDYQTVFMEPLWATVGTALATFDIQKELTLNLQLGDRLWYHIYRAGDFNRVASVYITEDPDTFLEIETLSICEPSSAKTFMIYEAGSRIAESISNTRLQMYSAYYGRTNSQPFSYFQNGPGSLKGLTTGSMIRQVKMANGANPSLFMSMKDWYENAACIDNIGLGIEWVGESRGEFGSDFGSDYNHGYNNAYRLRVEDWKYFYQDDVILSLKNVNKITTTSMPDEHVAIFKGGYNKWEAEEYNGLDELMTKREYRTQLDQVNNVLDKVCGWIASGYAIEITRRKGPDSKDWRYDNDTFVICLQAAGDSVEVELGHVLSSENIFSADTLYNFRISPARNLLRWASRVLASYRNLGTDDKIIFSSGEGNYVAAGELDSAFEKWEAGPIEENGDISLSSFADPARGRPITRLERDSFEYPLTRQEFVLLKRNPYKRIEYSNQYRSKKGWIDEINFLPNEGKATFKIIPSIS